MLSIFIKDIFEGISKYQILSDFVVPFVFDFVVPLVMGLWLEKKYEITKKVTNLTKTISKQIGINSVHNTVQQKSGRDSISNTKQNKITTLFGKPTFNFRDNGPTASTEEKAKGNPQTIEMNFPTYDGVLEKKQLEICRKVKDISKKLCGEGLDLQRNYELSMVAVNSSEVTIAASRFLEMYRDILRVFAGISKGDSRKDFQELQQVVSALERATRDEDTGKVILKQIEYCEKATWKLIVSFPL